MVAALRVSIETGGDARPGRGPPARRGGFPPRAAPAPRPAGCSPRPYRGCRPRPPHRQALGDGGGPRRPPPSPKAVGRDVDDAHDQRRPARRLEPGEGRRAAGQHRQRASPPASPQPASAPVPASISRARGRRSGPPCSGSASPRGTAKPPGLSSRPSGSIHVATADPGAGRRRRIQPAGARARRAAAGRHAAAALRHRLVRPLPHDRLAADDQPDLVARERLVLQQALGQQVQLVDVLASAAASPWHRPRR